MARHVLVLFAHPAVQSSRVNRAMLSALAQPHADGTIPIAARGAWRAGAIAGVELHDLYETYPDFYIDVQAEQSLLERADLIVLQHPFLWYSTPALLKQWLDEVLELGWAYGDGGTKLAGKDFLLAISTGGGAHTYHPDGHNRFPIHEMLRPLEATAWLCGMRWRAPLLFHGTFNATDEDIVAHAERYRELVAGYLERGSAVFASAKGGT